MSKRRRLRSALAAGCALALGACAFTPALQRVAVDHNRMVAEAEDELTLLNIVRASHRFPLHFTAVTQVNGNASLSMNGSMAIGLDPGPDPTGASIGAGVSSNPSFQASVLATDKFQRGIQAPIGSELIAYYLDEGWRDELIMALFIERLEPVGGRTGRANAVVNEPETGGAFADILCTHELVTEPTTASRPLARFEELLDQSIVGDGGESAAKRRAEIDSFLSLTQKEGVHLSGDTLVLTGSSNSVRLVARKTSRCEGVAPDTSGIAYRPRFRSTLGVIYFLGEYLRGSEEFGPDSVYRLPSCSGNCTPGNRPMRPLIDIRSGGGNALIATGFRGQRYFISASENEDIRSDTGEKPRTMQVVAIIQQLVNLQKSADSLPSSVSITRVN